jgi:uncharacterized membrane protein
MNGFTIFLTTFLTSAVEAIEMVTIVVGVGATRGWRSTVLGTVAGFGVLVAVVVVLGAALTAIPIGVLRFIIGTLLLVFGVQWFRKGVVRVAARGFAGIGEQHLAEAAEWTGPGIDWTAFVLAFKGVVLEGLEIAIIVVSFGVASRFDLSILGGVSALVIIGGVGLALRGVVTRIPRSFLQLVVGVLLTTFGTFWALEGLGVDWPLGDGSIPALLVLYLGTALIYTTLERRRLFGLVPRT